MAYSRVKFISLPLPLPCTTRFSLKAVRMGFVVVKVALARVLHRVIRLYRLSMIPPINNSCSNIIHGMASGTIRRRSPTQTMDG
jgi:hypothetical protein